MSDTFLGLDADQMATLRASLASAGETISQVRLQQSTALIDTPWQGADASAYRDQWFGSFVPSLIRISDTLTGAADTVTEQAADQDRASSGGGSANAVGSATVGAGAATLGAGAAATGAGASPPTGAGQPGASTGTTATRPGDPVNVRTPFYSQFEGGHGYTPGNTACFRAATAMARDAGATVLGPADRIQVATSEATDGSVTVDPTRMTQGRSYIDSELEAGRPVVVGVSHKAGYNGNVDRLTDHFVVVTGRGTNPDGSTYYTFNDPATRHATIGSDTRVENRFQVGADGGLYRDMANETSYLTQKDTWVSMVRRNRESGG